jgi:hypothetical protein
MMTRPWSDDEARQLWHLLMISTLTGRYVAILNFRVCDIEHM